MEVLSMQFLSALAAIVVIDLVLAGDNAIVIALATRKLPPHLRKSAIIWGTVGAVVVRSLLTVVVVWLLRIPGLMLAGGVMLIWIAYKLLADQASDEHEISSADSFWSALKTIVVADLVMGLDNVLAVAGAAHGSFLLVVIGLLISIPIVVWGSQMLLKLVDRFPSIVYIGAAVLAWTAAKMIVSERMVKPYIEDMAWISWLTYTAVMAGVLGLGYLANKSGSAGPAVQPSVGGLATQPAMPGKSDANKEGFNITKFLVPVDDSHESLNAVRYAASMAMERPGLEVHLLHVCLPMPHYIAKFLRRGERRTWNASEAERVLAPARELLDRHGVAHAQHVEPGDAVPTIDRVARRIRADQILVGGDRKPLPGFIFGRTLASSLKEVSRVPVQVVAGEPVSALARYGVPAGVGALIALLLVATD